MLHDLFCSFALLNGSLHGFSVRSLLASDLSAQAWLQPCIRGKSIRQESNCMYSTRRVFLSRCFSYLATIIGGTNKLWTHHGNIGGDLVFKPQLGRCSKATQVENRTRYTLNYINTFIYCFSRLVHPKPLVSPLNFIVFWDAKLD